MVTLKFRNFRIYSHPCIVPLCLCQRIVLRVVHCLGCIWHAWRKDGPAFALRKGSYLSRDCQNCLWNSESPSNGPIRVGSTVFSTAHNEQLSVHRNIKIFVQNKFPGNSKIQVYWQIKTAETYLPGYNAVLTGKYLHLHGESKVSSKTQAAIGT